MSQVTFTNGEAYVDVQPVQPTPGGTLHVSGLADTGNTNEAKLEKMMPQGINPAILMLEIIQLDFVPAQNPQQVEYEEGLETTDQYTRIEIFADGVKIGEIDKIMVVH